ncbi:MAG: aminotransferase class I/II-fold pyridoxal phosphate-dependent enzyme, partial [Pseudomonadota bacterium]
MDINSSKFHRDVRPFWVMKLHAMASEIQAKGGEICHLEAGLPEFPTPKPVLQAANEALDKYSLAYAPSTGIMDLRQRIKRHYQDYYHCDLSVDEILITTGSSGGFLIAFLGAFKPGATIAVFDPSYPAYRNILNALGFKVVTIDLDLQQVCEANVSSLEALWQQTPFEGLILANPSNPTGVMIDKQEIKAILEFCDAHDVRIVADEIYHALEWGPAASSLRQFSSKHVIVNSFSKYFAMTGWRVGWLVVPKSLFDNFIHLQSSLFISAPTISQYAALKAFECRNVFDEYKQIYKNNRDYLLTHLPKLGIHPIGRCDGTFYLYCDISTLTNDSTQWCIDTLKNTGVGIAPGEDFELNGGKKNIRISFARNHAEIKKAISLLS